MGRRLQSAHRGRSAKAVCFSIADINVDPGPDIRQSKLLSSKAGAADVLKPINGLVSRSGPNIEYRSVVELEPQPRVPLHGDFLVQIVTHQ